MSALGWLFVGLSAGLIAYAYSGYPVLLRILARARPKPLPPDLNGDWPHVSFSVPVYNEERQIRPLLESLLRVEYPAEKRQILVVSDGSDDATDEIVRDYANRGVELLRMPVRVGKSAAENAARSHLRGDIVINTDASARIHPAAVMELVRWFRDPTIGLTSARDVSIGSGGDGANKGEMEYVGFEMRLRDLETRVDSIVGASGCLYAVRSELHRVHVPEHLSRDFMSALTAREHGYRAVSVPQALCFVPRTPSLKREYRRKVRTITRGIQTLLYKRHLLDPRRAGLFAWMLWSHKVCRWAAGWATAAALLGLCLLAPEVWWARPLLAVVVVAGAATALAWRWPESRTPPAIIAIPAYFTMSNVAACVGTIRALRGRSDAVWEPTRRRLAVGD